MFKRIIISIFSALLLVIQPNILYAEVTMVDAPEPIYNYDTYNYEGQEVAALPVAVAILLGVGLTIVRTQAVKTLSRAAARKAAENYQKGLLRRVGRNPKKRCFSVKGGKAARVLLAADRSTILWAGDSHNTYEKEIGRHCN